MLHENGTDSCLVYGTSSLGELLLTAIPTQPTDEGSNILVPKLVLQSQLSRSVTFFLELNLDTRTIWYQIDQCHFAYAVESLVPYLNYSQTCVQLSPLGNGKLTVIYRVTTIIILYTGQLCRKYKATENFGKLSSDCNIQGDHHIQRSYIEV